MYQLTATLHGTTNRKTVWAQDDSSAMFEAIGHIMDRAAAEQTGPWARGEIKLIDSKGNLVAEMEAK